MSDEWISIYGCSTKRSATLNICGGCAEWWNYKLVFQKLDRERWGYTLYREDGLGLHRLPSKLVFRCNDDLREEIKEVDKDYKCEKDEIPVDYDFFSWSD